MRSVMMGSVATGRDDGLAGSVPDAGVAGARAFPIVLHPANAPAPVLVSVPHYGTLPLPETSAEDYREARFATFAYGFADTFAADLYGDLYEHGATVLATPFSRMFVDLNRRRDDFERCDGEVRSCRGVVRTHTMREVPIFVRPLRPAELEARLQALYDPYYAVLDALLRRLRDMHGGAVLLDGHTGSPRRMRDHQVIIGTRRDATCAPPLAAAVTAIFRGHGFEVHQDVTGYTGGNIVATFGQPRTGRVHAIQIEINASLLMTTPREELIALISRGDVPEKAVENIARVRSCLREIVAALPAALAALPRAWDR
jgi:N-formylglutamate deformylase